MSLNDEINTELDKRKIQKLVDDDIITAEDIANAPILSVSECCGADLLGEPNQPEPYLTCAKCGRPCLGAEK